MDDWEHLIRHRSNSRHFLATKTAAGSPKKSPMRFATLSVMPPDQRQQVIEFGPVQERVLRPRGGLLSSGIATALARPRMPSVPAPED